MDGDAAEGIPLTGPPGMTTGGMNGGAYGGPMGTKFAPGIPTVPGTEGSTTGGGGWGGENSLCGSATPSVVCLVVPNSHFVSGRGSVTWMIFAASASAATGSSAAAPLACCSPAIHAAVEDSPCADVDAAGPFECVRERILAGVGSPGATPISKPEGAFETSFCSFSSTDAAAADAASTCTGTGAAPWPPETSSPSAAPSGTLPSTGDARAGLGLLLVPSAPAPMLPKLSSRVRLPRSRSSPCPCPCPWVVCRLISEGGGGSANPTSR